MDKSAVERGGGERGCEIDIPLRAEPSAVPHPLLFAQL